MRRICCLLAVTVFSGYAERDLHPLNDKHPLVLEMQDKRVNVHQDVIAPGRPVTVLLIPKDREWDCSSKLWILADVENAGREPVTVRATVTALKGKGWEKNTGGAVVQPGKVKTLPVLILPAAGNSGFRQIFGEMRGYPGGYQHSSWRQIDASGIKRIRLDFFTGADRVECEISNLRAAVDFEFPNIGNMKQNYVPATDDFGQNRHADWPEKVRSEDDLALALQRETAELETFQPLENRSRFGGWTGGKRFAASGHFQTLEKDGVWWLVDSDGYPFWSLGIDCLNLDSGKTKTPGIGAWNPRQKNLQKKYGENWKQEIVDLMHRRLHVWGVNTLGNWSSSDFYQVDRTPYTVAVHYWRPVIPEKNGDSSKALPDVFHPEFRQKTLEAVSWFETEAADPWCIGFFIDNELSFSQSASPATKALAAPESCYSRQELIRRLKEKYGDLDALNVAWGTQFDGWKDLRPAKGPSWRDLLEFSEAWYREYFETCRDAVREVAPNKLYLGSRINHLGNQTALSICAETADVVSINLYDYTPEAFIVPDGFNAPVMIGEFHFGTITERGMWGGGLCTGMDIGQSADLFENYVTQAVKNPLIVGAHWFQMIDQPLTGRGDGENYRIGFVDVTDTPYPEMTDACRRVAEKMYGLRWNGE
jgi:hypothetical protein